MNSLTMYLIYGLPGLVLFVLHVRRRRRLERQSLKTLQSTGAAESLENCSCQSFDHGTERKDALQASRSFPQKLMRAERQLVTAPTR